MGWREITACISLVSGAILLFFIAIGIAMFPYILIVWMIAWVFHHA